MRQPVAIRNDYKTSESTLGRYAKVPCGITSPLLTMSFLTFYKWVPVGHSQTELRTENTRNNGKGHKNKKQLKHVCSPYIECPTIYKESYAKLFNVSIHLVATA